MKSLHAFNGLNGAIVTRIEIENLIHLAKCEEQTDIIYRLSKVLNDYPESKKFDFEIDKPATEVVPNSFLTGLDYIYEPIENVGLGKAVSASDIYDMITERMLNMIKEANKGDYKRAWKEEGYIIPYNFVSKKGYRGVNTFMLMPMFGLLDNPYFLTFKQVVDLGGKVKKGSHGHEVVYFSSYDKKYTDVEIERINAVVENIDGTKTVEKGDGHTNFFLKYYNVFNGADIEGIDFDLDNFKLAGKVISDTEIDGKDNQKIELAEAIIENYPAPQPPIYFQGSSAFYTPSKDTVTVPKMTDFDSSQSFYRTLLHELSHSTGHESRLKRDFSGKFGSKEYAFEELIAEFGAVFLSAQAGIMFYTNKNHAGYLKGWNEVLVPQLENDNKFLMKAASQAQKIADFVLQPDAKGEFLFMKNDKKILEKAATPIKKPIKTVAKKPIAKKALPKNKFGKDELVKVIIGKHKNHIGKITHCMLDEENEVFYYNIENIKDEISENNLAVATELKTVVKKVVAKKVFAPVAVVGYALLDSISSEIIATKKTLHELKTVWENLSENEIGKGTETFVYEITKNAAGKNVLDKKIDIVWIKETPPEPNKKTTSKKKDYDNDTSVKTIDIDSVFTDTARFQNRNKLNEGVINQIIENYNPAKFDAIVVWHDTKAHKTFVLAGHHRLEAMERMNKKTISVKFFDGTEAEAIKYAKLESNAGLFGVKKGLDTAWFPQYIQFKDKPKEAIKHLLKVKKGDCINALYRSDIGYIDIVWGKNDSNNKGFGLKHIVEKHGKEIASLGFKIEDFLPIVIQNGNLTIANKDPQKIILESKTFRVVLISKEKKQFVLSAFDLRPLSKKQGLRGVLEEINLKKSREHNKSDDGVGFRMLPLYSKTSILKNKDTKKGLGMTLAEKKLQPKQIHEYYKIDNRDISTFLGKIEKKNKESVVITLAGGQGSGKTRMLFQLMNAFAQNYKCGHASIEEHPESALYNDKVDKYLNTKAQHNITSPEIENISDLENLILENDIIFIDSFAKLQETENRFEVDKDLRKKYDGKLFVIIFQQTVDGKMRGGSKSQFDGDIILLTQPFPNYQDNYIYPDKNRYNSIPLDELKLNIYTGKRIIKEVAKAPIVNKFSFNIN